MKHYLYRHIRLDNNQVFYIGIGTKSSRKYNTFKSTYYRAHIKKGRNIIWKRIVNKTPYKIEILEESDDYDYLKLQEINLIAEIGKRNYYGTLCNITDGGDGCLGVTKPKGKYSPYSRKIYQYSLDGSFIKEWESGNDIQRELNYWSNSIYNCCNKKKKNKTAYGFQWSYEKVDNLSLRDMDYNCKTVLQFTRDNKFIREWKSTTEVQKNINIKSSHIIACCNKSPNRITAGGYKWEYKN